MPEGSEGVPASFSFDVSPNSSPPTNVHALIGRNNVGKSHVLNCLAKLLIAAQADDLGVVNFADQPARTSRSGDFAGVVSVSFSAFDGFFLPEKEAANSTIKYSYVGLKKAPAVDPDPAQTGNAIPSIKNEAELELEFSSSLRVCLVGDRRQRLIDGFTCLGSDPIFDELGLIELLQLDEPHLQSELTDEDRIATATQLFRRLSSGHRAVLLTITRLVEKVEERTLVLIDEPEAHLHPPLLSSLVRALSNLLTDQNGVAIIATHSPVVLQEVPRSCVSIMRRNGMVFHVEPPGFETFGESIGVLTREVFGLEVTLSGFHKLLLDAASECEDLGQMREIFDGQLGSEAIAILHTYFAHRTQVSGR